MNPWLVVVALVAVWIAYRVHYWRTQGRALQHPGFLPPPPSWSGRALLRVASRLGVFTFVGPVTVVHTAHDEGVRPTVIITNHQFELDFMVVATALRTSFRHLGKTAEMRGMRGMLAAFCGFFSANVEAGRAQEESGNAVIEAATRIIAQGGPGPLLWFAQGRLVYDNLLREEDFRTGAIRTLQRAAERGIAASTELTILPAYIAYRRATPGQGGRRFTQVRQVNGERIREVILNRGATIVIGRPIRLQELPADPRHAIERVRLELLALAERIRSPVPEVIAT